jgi:hypothetical protein
MNGSPLLQQALATIVHEHLQGGQPCSPQYGLRCAGCVNPQCRHVPNPVASYPRLPVTVTRETRRLLPTVPVNA